LRRGYEFQCAEVSDARVRQNNSFHQAVSVAPRMVTMTASRALRLRRLAAIGKLASPATRLAWRRIVQGVPYCPSCRAVTCGGFRRVPG
jgi:hypothetical protein